MAQKSSRYVKILSTLPNTLQWANTLDVSVVREFILKKDAFPRIFLGSGGSLSAAYLAAQLSVGVGMVSTAMTPYQYIFSSWCKLPAKVFLLSAGGRNVDALNAYKTSLANSQDFGALLTTTSSPLAELMAENCNKNVFAYPLRYRDGFLATNSLLAFYSLLIRIFKDEEVRIDDWSYSENMEKTVTEFISSTYELPTDKWDEFHAALYEARETDRFYILYSPDTLPIAVDLESRFAEGAVGCLQISDYRNFAHGRFNWFHQRIGQTAIIALKSPESKSVAEGILSEIPPEIPVMRLSTEFEGPKGTIDLLIKGMELVKILGQRWGLDVGAPTVPDFGRVIHSKDFM